MLPLVMEGAVAVDALESVRAEIISLGLNQIRAKSLRAECINVFECRERRISMLPLMMEGAVAVDTLESMRAEIVSLCLDQIGAKSLRAECINVFEGRGRRISMLPLVMEGAVAVDALESVRAEIISPGLDQIGAQSIRAECVNVFEGRGRRISMLPLVMEGAVAIDALESVRAEIISPGLDQIGAKSLRAECVNIFESRAANLNVATRDGRSRRDRRV